MPEQKDNKITRTLVAVGVMSGMLYGIRTGKGLAITAAAGIVMGMAGMGIAKFVFNQ